MAFIMSTLRAEVAKKQTTFRLDVVEDLLRLYDEQVRRNQQLSGTVEQMRSRSVQIEEELKESRGAEMDLARENARLRPRRS